MVSFTKVAAAALALTLPVPAAHAYITGFTIVAQSPTTLHVTLSTALYPQRWVDFGIVWGLITPEAADRCGDEACVAGTQGLLGFTTLTGDEGSMYPYTFDEGVAIPAGTAAGVYLLKAAIPRLIGVCSFFLFFIF